MKNLMKTTVYQAQELHIERTKNHIHDVIQRGGLVVFPTETVYGIGANALDEKAVNRIFEAKGRPSDNPLIVHLSHRDQVIDYVENISDLAKTLMVAFWPGPLTLIFQKNNLISLKVTGGLNTIAIRMPQHPIALEVINIAKVPICAPSANISGKPSSTEFSHVLEDFNHKVDIIIDGGKTNLGLESTVLDLTTEIPTILRPGMITKEMIEVVLGFPIIDASDLFATDSPKSPGMKYKHYAPKGNFKLIRGEKEKIKTYLESSLTQFENQKLAIIAPKEFDYRILGYYQFDLGSLYNQQEIASNIYSMLRLMDHLSMDQIFMPILIDSPLGSAIMNRLDKASNHQIIDL